jgi:hypothetical protein
MKEPLAKRLMRKCCKEEQMNTARKSEAGVARGAAEWRRLVDEFSRSGETLGAFSARHGFSTGALEYWRRKFRDTGGQKKQFREYRLAPIDEPAGEVELRLPNGRSLIIRGRMDEGTIRRLLSVVG